MHYQTGIGTHTTSHPTGPNTSEINKVSTVIVLLAYNSFSSLQTIDSLFATEIAAHIKGITMYDVES